MKFRRSAGRRDRYLASSAPGRADFLNTHQDYKGLPVVPVALNLRTYILAVKTDSQGILEAASLDLREKGERYEDSFALVEEVEYAERGFFGNYLRAVAKVALETSKRRSSKATSGKFGMRLLIKSEVPVSAGLASSAALEVSFAALLNAAYGLGLNRRDLAEIGYRAENSELKIPCGRLDQYGSSYGGVILVECKPPYGVRRINFKDLCFVVVDSGIRHSTAEVHPARQSELERGLRELLENKSITGRLREKLSPRYDGAKWSELSEQELISYLPTLDEVARRRILFTLRMQRSTEFALRVMEKRIAHRRILTEAETVDGLIEFARDLRTEKVANSRIRTRQLLGSIMNYQHALLRDLYDVSMPKIEAIREAMIGSKAYGVKLSGAGLGGALIALVDNVDDGEATLDAAMDAGAREGWLSGVGEGAKIENMGNRKIQSLLHMCML